MLNNYLPDDRRFWKNLISLHVSVIECTKQNKFQIILGFFSLHIWYYVVFMVKTTMKRVVTNQVSNSPEDLQQLPLWLLIDTQKWLCNPMCHIFLQYQLSLQSSHCLFVFWYKLLKGGAAENRMWLERDERTKSLGHTEGECGSSLEWKYHSESL